MKDEFAETVAEHVLAAYPDSSKDTWGLAFLELAEDIDGDALEVWSQRKLIAAAGRATAAFRARRESKQQAERLAQRGISVSTGRPINPTLSVRTPDGTRQLGLWTEVPPREFVEAVLREQSIVDGRRDSNAVRLRLVRMLQADESLMALPSLAAVCTEVEIDPDALGLEELEAS